MTSPALPSMPPFGPNQTPTIPPMAPFMPMFIFPGEYASYGLPNNTQQPDIDNLVGTASAMIDEFCGRTDGDGSGSLVYTTYQERLMSQSPGRNIYYIPHRPLSSITQAVWNKLVASGASASGSYQPYYSGFLPTSNTLYDGTPSAIIQANGRYAFPRRDTYPLTNDPYSFVNPLTIITLFGGPPPWIPIDMVNLDYDPQTGECWVASGMWLERYTEVVTMYNSGYDPTNMPYKIKLATSALVKNLMMRGSGTTGMRSFNFGKSGISAQFDPDVIDANIQRLLAAFVTTRSY